MDQDWNNQQEGLSNVNEQSMTETWTEEESE